MSLPKPDLDAIPFTPLTAQFLDDMIENTESLSYGTGFEDGAVTTRVLEDESVTGAKIDRATVLGIVYPVGSIYVNAGSSANPSTLLGFGTWEQFGAGRAIVGFDASDSDFDALEKAGGAKTHQLTKAQLPRITGTATFHGSEAATVLQSVSGDFSGTARSQYRGGGTNTSGAGSRGNLTLDVGSNQAHNNMQPYITVRMWKRTA